MRRLVEFIFPRRLHRIAFLLRAFSADRVMDMLCGISDGTPVHSFYLPGTIIILAIYQFFFICLPRARDFEMNGWWLLFLFVPGLNIILSFFLLLRAPVFLHLQGEPLRAGEQPTDLSDARFDQTFSWLSTPQK